MRAGRLSHRITFYARSVTRDAMGGETVTWVEQDQDWADVLPLQGREYFAAQQVEAELTIRFRVRYRSDVTEAWRIEWEGKRYNIRHVFPVDGRKDALEMMCTSVPNG